VLNDHKIAKQTANPVEQWEERGVGDIPVDEEPKNTNNQARPKRSLM
jgi:hypothetical protein